MASACLLRRSSAHACAACHRRQTPQIQRWDASYTRLRAYLARSGGEYPRRHTDDREERTLACWVYRQRVARRVTGPDRGTRMTPDRAAKLEQLPGWKWVVILSESYS